MVKDEIIKEIEVDGDNFACHINRIILRLHKILNATWSWDDTRKLPAIGLLEGAVWLGVYSRVDADADVITLDKERLKQILVGINDRVAIRIEAFFPEGQQCNALKSLATSAIWFSYKPIWTQETRISTFWDQKDI